MTLATLARLHPRWVDAAIRLDRAPAVLWLALQGAALLPTWRWMIARWRDGADDPLGLLALAALAWLLWQQRHAMRGAPRLGWLAAGAVLTVAATLGRGAGELPPLVAGLLSVCALACTALAFLPRRTATLPVLGLAVLALPLLSSLQFYAGYPLRVVTAEASRWLLAPLFATSREGSSLWIDGHLVIVDAPCSGVQMAWLGYFTACAVALFIAPRDEPEASTSRRFLARLPAVSALVLAGNVLRNTLLVAFEGVGRPLPGWAHEAAGLLVLALVCGAIAGVMARAPHARAADRIPHRLPRSTTVPLSGDRHAHPAR